MHIYIYIYIYIYICACWAVVIHMHWLYIMSSKKKPIIKDLAAFTYNMFKIHDDFVNFCHSAHICSTIYCNRTWARGLI